jgi:predicted nucleic acid-binding protein
LTLVKFRNGNAKTSMNRVFIDSNICVYWFDKSDRKKQDKSFDLLKDKPYISSQVIIETYLACSRKLRLPTSICDENTLILCEATHVVPIDGVIFSTALKIKSKYQFSFLDAIIVAAALEAECTTLYSEDIQHGQVIEGKLTVINPFLAS